MSEMTTIGQICLAHKYCTDCPKRKECTIRPSFYSDEDYEIWKEETIRKTRFVTKLLGYQDFIIEMSVQMCIEMMNKRRQEERRLHQTYVKE